MGKESDIQWTQSTWNPWHGCKKVSAGCKYCLDPETMILMGNWEWKPLKEVEIGDNIIAFNEKGKGLRLFKKAIVEAILEVEKPAVKILTEHTEIIASHDHPFLNANKGVWVNPEKMKLKTKLRYIPDILWKQNQEYQKGYITGITLGDGTFRWEPGWGSVWKKESPQCFWKVELCDIEILKRLRKYLLNWGINLTIKQKSPNKNTKDHHRDIFKIETRKQADLKIIHAILNASKHTEDYMRGWLGGMFDAEGRDKTRQKTKNNAIRIAQKDASVLEKIKDFGAKLGFEFVIENHSSTVSTARLIGRSIIRANFLMTVQGAVQRKKDAQIDQHVKHIPDKVIGLEEIGKRRLIDIQTSERTFIANGLLTHNCYMYRDKDRYGQDPTTVLKSKTKFAAPLNWDEPRLIFTCSWSDWFIDEADEWRREAWEIIKATPQHTYQILTKRPDRIEQCLPPDWGKGYPNIWLGVSIENQDVIGRMQTLQRLQTDSSNFLTFVSAEPLLGWLDFEENVLLSYDFEHLDWLIIGGESGNEEGKYRYRPCDMAWILDLIEQAKEYNIPVFVKQLGTHLAKTLGLKHRHGGDISEWPEELQIREFP